MAQENDIRGSILHAYIPITINALLRENPLPYPTMSYIRYGLQVQSSGSDLTTRKRSTRKRERFDYSGFKFCKALTVTVAASSQFLFNEGERLL